MKYFGIDLGDGETAVATVTGAGAVVPQILTLGNTKSILSLVGEDKKGHIVVGENVLLDFQMQTRSARFKSRFLRDEGASESIRKFAKGVHALLEGELSQERYENIRIALGCPAGWAEPDRERYASLVSSAGFPNVTTVSESRAAFMYANHSSDLGLTAKQLSRPALVIDIGSSTTDFAHIVNGREANIGVFGDNSLGGGLLDYYLLEETIPTSRDPEKLSEVFAKYPVWRNYCELDARKIKESYFTAQNDGEEHPSVSRRSSVYVDISSPLSFNIVVNDDVIGRVLNRKLPELDNRSFMEALNDALAQAQKVTMDYPPELVILTGGASRMRFFREACQAAFPKAMLVACPEPEYSIAYGLSVAARTDHALSLFRDELGDFFSDHDLLRNEIIRNLPLLQTKLSPIIVKNILLALKDAMAQAKGLNKEQFIAQFEQCATERLKETEIQNEMNTAISQWAVEKLTPVQDQINLMCDKYYVDRMDMALARMKISYPVSKLKLPIGAYILAVLGKVPIFNEIAQWMSRLLTSSMEKQVRQSLLEADGIVAKQLITSLEEELRRMIGEQIANIELLIH